MVNMDVKEYPEVAVGAYILDENGMILLIRSPKWKDQWIIPGGHIELGESIMETARREAKEEVGIDVEPEGVLTVAEVINTQESGFHRKAHFIYLEVICNAKAGAEPKIDNREVEEARWFTLEDALSKVKEHIVLRTIKAYMDQKKTGKMEFINVGK